MRDDAPRCNRRELLRWGALGLGAAGLPAWAPLARAAAPRAQRPDRILVVLELSGGNDGLNTLAPYGDDAYYRHRPQIGIRPERLRKIDEHYGFSSGMAGFERLYGAGQMAVIHGCGYDQPSFSHFSADSSQVYLEKGMNHVTVY